MVHTPVGSRIGRTGFLSWIKSEDVFVGVVVVEMDMASTAVVQVDE